VAILPQLFLLQRTGEAEAITTHYLAALGAYRGLYIPNWIYRWVQRFMTSLGWKNDIDACALVVRYFTEGSVDPIAVVAGLVQTALYLDFFYIYFTR
jgi:ER lumen protein retaining receptor